MTTREFVSIEKSLLAELPGYAIKGSLMFIPPVESLLRGLSFEGSSFDRASFYVTAFVMPLCVPTTHLYFNFGSRVRDKGGGDRWDSRMPGLTKQLSDSLKLTAVPFLSRVESLLDFVDVAREFPGNPHTPKAVAFALARAGRIAQAIEILGGLPRQLDVNVKWQREIAGQASTLKAILEADPSKAMEQLRAWEVETVRSLGLGQFQVERVS